MVGASCAVDSFGTAAIGVRGRGEVPREEEVVSALPRAADGSRGGMGGVVVTVGMSIAW